MEFKTKKDKMAELKIIAEAYAKMKEAFDEYKNKVRHNSNNDIQEVLKTWKNKD